MTEPSARTIADRADALERAIELCAGHVAVDDEETVRSVLAKVRDRMRHGTDHTVVALVGSTGVGKSSLFNAIVGSEISTVGVRRPTTGVAHAAVWGDGGGRLLDWLDIRRRHQVDSSAPTRHDLVLIDLPDFDSIDADNRAEVDRLVELVDAMIWVTDPQKYADQALHDGYLRPLAGHGDVLRFVVNKTDTVPADSLDDLVADFRRRLLDDGIGDPVIALSSTQRPGGLDEVERLVDTATELRRAAVARLGADLRNAAATIAPQGTTDGVTRRARRDLVERLGHAAGADEAGRLVAAQHRKDARMALGWPPVALVERLRRRHPISELPRPSASATARSEIDLALRDLAESVSIELEPPWPAAVRSVTGARADDLVSRLGAITQTTARHATRRPGWWTPVAWLQRVVTLLAVAGALWLLAVAVLGGFFRLETDPLLIDTPGWEWIPLPSLAVVGGLAIGAALALAVRIPVAVAAGRRSATARRDLLDAVGDVADETVLADVATLLEQRRLVAELLATVSA